MSDNEPEYLSTKEVASRMNVSVSTINKLARTGKIDAIRVLNLWRFPTDVTDADKWRDK